MTNRRLLVPFFASMMIVCSSVVFAARPAAEICADVAAKAKRTLWGAVRETGDELFCRKGWTAAKVDEFAGCMQWTLVNNLSNKLKNRWNREFDKAGAEWGTWGPRGVSEEWEKGTIRGGFKRTFFGAALAYGKSTVEVVKEGGRAEASVTACRIDQQGRVVSAQQASFPNGNEGVGSVRRFVLDNMDTYILGVVVDTPASLNSFQYRTRVTQQPQRNDIGPVKGLADLHVHQFMNIAMGGRMYWGEPSGPPQRALMKEYLNTPGHTTTRPTVDELLSKVMEAVKLGSKATIGIPNMDANILMKGMSPGTDDEGRFTLGTGGHQNYEDWPSHKDRSHQQVHISWLEEAHKRDREKGVNLNLIIVSIVHNNILCTALKTVDEYGNVPRFNPAGQITGWESATWGCSDDESIVRQIKAVHATEAQYPWYRIAMNPWHARQIIADGDLAVVLSLETDKVLSDAGGNYSNWKQQLDGYRAMGVTTMQIVHESNNKFAGAALHRDMMEALQFIHWPIESVGNLIRGGNTFDIDQRRYNRLGLTAEGEQLVDALVLRNMPIDLAHLSHDGKQQLFRRAPKGYALYDSHTKFECLVDPRVPCRVPRGRPPHQPTPGYRSVVIDREQEFVLSEDLIQDYLNAQVVLGLRAASIDIKTAPGSAVPNDCPGSAKSFAQYVQYAHQLGFKFAFGTDWNTGVSHAGPRFGPGRCWAASPELKPDFRATRQLCANAPCNPGLVPSRAASFTPIANRNYYFDGLAHIGMLPEFAVDLIENLRTPGAANLTGGAEAYLAMWERAYGQPPASTPVPPVSNLALGVGCTQDEQCKSGRCSSLDGSKGVCVCDGDGDCANGHYCNMGLDLKRNACVAKKADGETCPLVNGGRTCLSGKCKSARCYTAASKSIGQSCWVGDECRLGKCNNVADGVLGTCVCKADSDCGSGYWCDGGVDLKKNACRKKYKKGEVCGKVGELGVGHRCLSGQCKVSGLSTNLKCK